MTGKRFELYVNPHEQWDIVDRVESEEKNAICIYNDLGEGRFSSAPALCDLLNELNDENEQLKTQIKIFEKFLDENNLDIDWEIFCTVDECKKDSDDYGCKECKYLGVMWND